MKTILKFALMLILSSVAKAGLLQIPAPDASYLSTTTNIAITSPIGTDLVSISDGLMTINFSHIREVHQVPIDGWATWSSPPYSESTTPVVLVADGYNPLFTSVTLNFSSAVDVFGIEVEGDPFDIRTFTASFFNGSSLVDEIVLDVYGESGARLLAASATGSDVFTSLVISTDIDFALAQFRYHVATASIPTTTLGSPSTSISEPDSLMLLGLGIFGARMSRIHIKRSAK